MWCTLRLQFTEQGLPSTGPLPSRPGLRPDGNPAATLPPTCSHTALGPGGQEWCTELGKWYSLPKAAQSRGQLGVGKAANLHSGLQATSSTLGLQPHSKGIHRSWSGLISRAWEITRSLQIWSPWMERDLPFLVSWVQDKGPRSQNEHNPETNKRGSTFGAMVIILASC